MPAIDDIVGQFQLFNIEPSKEVISKCLQMCKNYNVDAEDLVDQWFAYTSSVLKGALPTVEYLERMERKEFLKAKEQNCKIAPVIIKESPYISPTAYPTSELNTEILGTPKGNHVPTSKMQTPIQARKLLDDMELTFGSPGTLSGTYSLRTDARSVRCQHGPKNAKFKRETNIASVKSVYGESLKSDQRFMYEILGKRGRCINNITEYLLEAIKSKHKLVDDKENDKVGSNMLFFGRIVSDSDGKINNQSVLLELTQKSNGSTVYLNLSNISKYSLFPGQSVGVKGTYEKTSEGYKDKIFVEEIFCDTTLDLLPEPSVTIHSLQLIIASGPFTTKDNLLFEPLNDLLQFAKENKPNILILMGPFYERSHPGIMNGQLTQSFESFFWDVIYNIMKTLESIEIHVIIVSSQKEPHHFPVYPTAPYEIREKYENLTFMPDPAMVNVNGLIIGTTTADVLFDISNFEIYMDKTNSGPPDRLGRIASHLLKQQSFYPLNPSHKDMCIDMSLMETNGLITIKPHILILPSNLRHFVKEIDDCLIINPERLTKGNGGGTFARVEIRAGETISVCNRSACQILKI